MHGRKGHYALAGDIGGTNSRLALYAEPDKCEQRDVPVVHTNHYRNLPFVDKYGSSCFGIILEEFMQECLDMDPDFKSAKDNDSLVIVACFACAGPIVNNACEFTNIEHEEDNFRLVIRGDDITISTQGMENYIKVGFCTSELRMSIHVQKRGPRALSDCDVYSFSVFLYFINVTQSCKIINDFVGQGYGSLLLNDNTDLVELLPGSLAKINPLGPKVCIGAGTGLGECYLTVSKANQSYGYECYPSEGGHVEYSPRTEIEVNLLKYLMKKFEAKHRVSVERVVSGKGLANVYDFLAQKFPDEVDAEVHASFLAAGDLQGKVVGDNITPGNLCDKALDIFAR